MWRALVNIISGHVGPEIQNDRPSLSCGSVAEAIGSISHFRAVLSVVTVGKHRPATRTADGVPEPKNRRVLMSGVSLEAQEAQTAAR